MSSPLVGLLTGLFIYGLVTVYLCVVRLLLVFIEPHLFILSNQNRLKPDLYKKEANFIYLSNYQFRICFSFCFLRQIEK